MKTPMQELIEQMWEIAKYGDSYEVAPCIEAAEAMLEKEKEFMQKIYANAKATSEMDEAVKNFKTKEK